MVPKYIRWRLLHGPKFLWKEKKHWPGQPLQLPELSKDDSKCRKSSGRANMIVHGKILEPLLSRYSSWDSLRKAIAWLVRFKKYLAGSVTKDPDSVNKGPLSDCGRGYSFRKCYC